LSENLKLFDKALSYHTLGDPEIREQITQSAMQVIAGSSDPAIKQAFFDKAKSELEKQIAKTPTDARYELFLGSFLNRTQLREESLKHLEKALTLSPKKMTIFFEIGSNYISQGNYPKAVEYLKKAYELEPHYLEARNFYALAAIYNKDLKLVDELSKPLYGTTLSFDDRFIKAYSDTKQYTRIVAILEGRVKENPTNPQFHVALAAGYLQVNERNKAIAEIQKAIELNPAFKEEGENYIKEIRAGRTP